MLPLVSGFMPTRCRQESGEREERRFQNLFSIPSEGWADAGQAPHPVFTNFWGSSALSLLCSPWVVMASCSCPPLSPHPAPKQQTHPLQSHTWGYHLFPARTEDEMKMLNHVTSKTWPSFPVDPNSISQTVLGSSPL